MSVVSASWWRLTLPTRLYSLLFRSHPPPENSGDEFQLLSGIGDGYRHDPFALRAGSETGGGAPGALRM